MLSVLICLINGYKRLNSYTNVIMIYIKENYLKINEPT